MTLLEIDKPEEINQSINPEVQVHTSRHTNELDKEKDHSSSMIRTRNLRQHIKSYATALTSKEKREIKRDSNNAECSDCLSRKHYNKETSCLTSCLSKLFDVIEFSDVVFISEHWLSNKFLPILNTFFVENYSCLAKP